MVEAVFEEDHTSYRDKILGIIVPTDYRRVATEHFMHLGWPVHRLSDNEIDCQRVQKGEPVNCGDHCRDGNAPHAFAWFGATHGFVPFTDRRMEMADRYKTVVSLVKESGQTPGDHSDEEHGDIHGCKYVSAALAGKVPGLEDLCEEDIFGARRVYQIHHQKLTRGHESTGLCLNFKEDCTVVPHGRFHSIDPMYVYSLVERLGCNFEEILQVSAYIAELVLPESQRNLYIV